MRTSLNITNNLNLKAEMRNDSIFQILEYDDFYVKINSYVGSINIHGFNLKLEEMNEDNIRIIGKIESLDIERIEE